MGITINKTFEEAFQQGIETYVAQLNVELLALAEDFAPRIQEWMIENKVWEDRTYDAVDKLFSEVEELTNGAVIYFGGRSEHQKYLEFSMSGRFQIIAPALDYWSVQIYNAVADLVKGAKVTSTEALPYGTSYRNNAKET